MATGLRTAAQSKTKSPMPHGREHVFTASMALLRHHFKAAKHLKAHPEFAWEKPALRDLDSHPFTTSRCRSN